MPVFIGRQNSRILVMKMPQLTALIWLGASLCSALAFQGADIPWTTYEAENMQTTGLQLGPDYTPFAVETEASGRKCVQLNTASQYVEFKAQGPANALVVRYCLADAPNGGGLDSTLSLSINGKP